MSKATALAPVEESNYALMRLPEETALDLIQSAISSGVTSFDFDRVRVPAGGGITWEIPTLEGEPESTKALTGVIVGIAQKKAYWATALEESGGGTPPDCRSDDGAFGQGNPGGPCRACPYNQFGSSSKGEGKACKDMMHVLIVPPNSTLPLLLSVPPTSIKPMRQFLLRAAGAGISTSAMEVALSLTKEKANGGQTYSRISASLGRKLGGEEAARFRAVAEAVKPLLSALPLESAEDEGDGYGYGD